MNAARTDNLNIDKCPDIQYLVENNIDPSRLVLLADSRSMAFKGDFLACDTLQASGFDDSSDYYFFETTHSSIYDRLPEAMFLMRDISKSLKRERKTRLFFSIFDTNIIYIRAYLSLLLALLTDRKKRREMGNFTELFAMETSELEQEQEDQLVSLMSIMHVAAANVGYLEHFLSSIFDRKVTIRENELFETEVPENLQSRLGEQSSCLGENMLLGKTVMERDSAFVVQIELQNGDDVVNFAPQSSDYRFMKKILGNLVSYQNSYDIKFKFTNEKARVKLGKNLGQAYLGRTTHV